MQSPAPKQEKNELVSFLSLFAVPLLLFLPIIYIGYGEWVSRTKPMFKVGECVTFYSDEWKAPGSWEKILEIGKHSYRTKKYFSGDLVREYSNDSSLEFREQRIYHSIPCPSVK